MSKSVDWYDTALVCFNGHLINASKKADPKHNSEYCIKCGASAITTCPSCKAKIRGDYYFGTPPFNLLPQGKSYYNKPAYCHACGAPYPWTEKSLATLKELASEAGNLTQKEREQLAKSFDDLVRETPETNIAILRFKRLLSKVGEEIGDAMRAILVDIASAYVKQQLGI